MLRGLFIGLLALAVTHTGLASPDIGAARLQFIDVETVHLLDYYQQKSHLRRLYGTVLPELWKNRAIGLPLFSSHRFSRISVEDLGRLSQQDPSLDWPGTPVEKADRISAVSDRNPGWLNNLALDRCREILRAHPKEVIPWVAEEMKREGGFKRIDSLLLFKEHFDVLTELLNRPDTFTAWSAAIALCSNEVGDNRAISLIVRRFPTLKPEDAHADCNLWILQKGRKANPDLMRLLSSPNAAVRFEAVKALAQSGDPDLLSIGEKLLNDPEERVRKTAATLLKVIRAK